jgi:long-chain fatty acid transport protein
MTRSLRPLLAASALALVTLPARPSEASGFLIYDMSAEALGKGAAVSATATEPATAFFNPAGLAFLPGYQVSIGSIFVRSRSEFEARDTGVKTKGTAGGFVLPTIYASAELGERLALGFGAFPAFGLGVEWPEGWIGRESAIEASIQTFNLNPSVAWELLPETLSVAAGVQVVRGAVELVTGLPPVVGGTLRIGGGTWGYGANAGLLYRPLPDELHLAFSYRSRVTLSFDEGRVDFDPSAEFATRLPDQGGRAAITLPDVFTLGLMWRPIPSLALTFDPNLVLWSTYDELVLDFERAPDQTLRRDYKNVVTLRFGADWQTPVTGYSLRGGVIFDQNPAPTETLSPSLPDANRVDFSIGFGYSRGAMKADVGYMLVYFVPSDARGGTEGPEGTYRSLAHLFGLSLTARFGQR